VTTEPRRAGQWMKVRISDQALVADLVRYMRLVGYLGVEEAGAVTVVPINAASAQGDRARVAREVESWRAAHPGVEIEISQE
jgi:hypothetical protein